jgi:protein TonB
VKGGTGSGVVGGIGPVTNQTYFEFQVEKPAEMLAESPKPKYPSVLESSGIAGEVQAQFVVSSSGKADMDSFKVLKSTNELFTQAVKNVLPRMKFSPAMIGGKPVNQLVQQSFQFAVPR